MVPISLWVYANDVNMLVGSICTVKKKKKTEALVDAVRRLD